RQLCCLGRFEELYPIGPTAFARPLDRWHALTLCLIARCCTHAVSLALDTKCATLIPRHAPPGGIEEPRQHDRGEPPNEVAAELRPESKGGPVMHAAVVHKLRCA